MQKLVPWLVGTFITADLFVAALWAAVAMYPALPVYWKPVSKISRPCSRWQTVVDSRARLRVHEIQESISAASRTLRVDGKLRLVRTPRGDWWIPNGETDPLPVLLAQHATNYYGDARTGVHPGDIVIDCGSHIGTFTRDALRRGARRVIAVDPAPDAAECFRRNFASELVAGTVVLLEKGIWDSEGSLTFYVNGNADAADSFVVHSQWSRRVDVPVTTIDAIVRDLKIERVDFIKADVKGATERMLAGGADTLERFRSRLALATEEPPEEPTRLIAAVKRLAPNYNHACGLCFYTETTLRMEAVLFQPRSVGIHTAASR